ncbi:MAG: hypothetical protein K0R08_338 [Solimicrobium sp.]|jgi:hypothetical protein|nr:hypothetical protein [Solimicrobium sp.]
MFKKMYGINETGQKVELNFKNLLIITENDSQLEINLEVDGRADKPDLALHICHGPLVEMPSGDKDTKLFKAVEGGRHFSILPGGGNLIYIKVVRHEPAAV